MPRSIRIIKQPIDARATPTPEPSLPRTKRGWRTRRSLLDAAEEVFGRLGYHRASVVDLTRTAQVALGTFYLYFSSKEAIFAELVRSLGHEMRRRLHEAAASAPDRGAAETAGLAAYLDYVAHHPHVYRILRESEFAAPDAFREWYERLTERYVARLQAAMEAGEFRQVDPEVAATVLMGIGDFLGMHHVLWQGRQRIPPTLVPAVIDVVLHGLAATDRD